MSVSFFEITAFFVPERTRKGKFMEKIPVWEKYTLSIEEAAAYFRIGENKLRNLVADNKTAKFLLWNGNRPQIKRRLFEEYIDTLEAI